MAKTKSQRMKEYRAKKLAEMGNAWLQKESLRTKQYYIPVEALSQKKAKTRREKVRKNVQNFRIKKKIESMAAKKVETASDEAGPSAIIEDENAVSSTTPNQRLIVKLPPLTSRSASAKKRVSHALAKANKKISSLKMENIALKRNLNTSRKRLERERKKNSRKNKNKNDPMTPKGKTDHMLRDAGLSPSTNRAQTLRKKLLFAECLSAEIQEASESNPSKRKIIANVASGKVMKKYRQFSMLKKSTKINWRGCNIKSKVITATKRHRNLGITMKISGDVREFLERDDNSRMLPGKADAVKDGKTKKQKRVLNDYLHNSFLKFTAEHSYKLSFATFCRYRPKHISLVNYASRDTCLCQKHQNFALKLRCLKSLNITTITSPDKFVVRHRESGIEEELNKITRPNVSFKQWKRVKMNDGKERMRIVDVEMKKQDFQVEMTKVYQEFLEHVDRVKTQYAVVRQLKENLPNTHAVVQMDFAENYTCQNMEEIQSAYWNASMVTLHPTVTYYIAENCALTHYSCVYVSECLHHNAAMVNAIIQKHLTKLKELNPLLTHIHFWTDSPTSQYRNKSIFDITSQMKRKFGMTGSWHYFESGHGKGPCDGIGGTAKRNADNAVKQGKAIIQDASDFIAWAIADENNTSIKYEFITSEEYEHSRASVDERNQDIRPVKGTMSIHAVAATSDGNIIRKTSCICENCFSVEGFTAGTNCGWALQNLNRREVIKNTEENTNTASNEQQDLPQESARTTAEISLEEEDIGKYVAAVYDNNLFIGKILKVESHDAEISFMKDAKIRGQYIWPRPREDTIWVDFPDILCFIKDPEPTGRSKRAFKVDMVELESAQNRLREYKSKKIAV